MILVPPGKNKLYQILMHIAPLQVSKYGTDFIIRIGYAHLYANISYAVRTCDSTRIISIGYAHL